jgi:hypothetical protein
MLYPRQALRRFNNPPQAIIVKFVGGCASRAPAKSRAHRDDMVFLGDVLMNRVVRKAGERKRATREKDFDLIGGRKLPDAIKDVGGSVSG